MNRTIARQYNIEDKAESSIEWRNVRTIILALIAIIFVRTFCFQPFYIPSGSMIPTLVIGDNILVSKTAYGYSKFSFPFGHSLNSISGRFLDLPPELGDVAVFRPAELPNQDFIKRIVGLPGDRVQFINGRLYINGFGCPLRKIPDAEIYTDDGEIIKVQQYHETLPNGVEHKIIKRAAFGQGSYDNTQEFLVPPGHYFMVGDNRDGSNDSRAQDVVGFVPYENLVGKAKIVFFSTGSHAHIWEFWKWLLSASYSRILNWIS